MFWRLIICVCNFRARRACLLLGVSDLLALSGRWTTTTKGGDRSQRSKGDAILAVHFDPLNSKLWLSLSVD